MQKMGWPSKEEILYKQYSEVYQGLGDCDIISVMKVTGKGG